MPLYKTITVNPNTKVLIWKIEESYENLSEGISLTDHCRERVEGMKSDLHRRGFMSVRHLLAAAGYTDHDLYYDEVGKPHLTDDKHISITHSFIFSGIIISDAEVGIDIEKQRNKILKIAHKFTPIKEYRTLANDDAVMRKLTMVWGAKESLYKSFARKGVSFLEHIVVSDFDMDILESSAVVTYDDKEETYDVWFLEFEGFTCAYALIREAIPA
ncbi:4'-phosphopantetheinyl transferase family protein [Luteirhabdus pelagi]|uniref:4'-phosphopantetheinyl transferase family protein n=1 Tax=Luteirhabdus pelagi TaxID=2792783 RepID=UPI00193A836C|nr:4'-phosphopantetheinyl transferase family protein [Luteirhabdus pelagi]